MKRENGFMHDVITSSCGQLFVMAIMFGMNKLLSMNLAPAEYALYGIANKSAQVVSFCVLFCLGIAIPRYLPMFLKDGQIEKSATFLKTGIVCVAVLSCLVLAGGIHWNRVLSRMVFASDGMDKLFAGMLFFAVGLSFCSILYAFFRAVDDFFRFGLSQIVFQLLLFILSVVLFSDLASMMMCWGGVLLIGGAGWLWHACGNFFCSEVQWCSWGRLEVASLREIVGFCLPRVPGEFILFSFQTIPLIILNNRIGAEATAGYVVALMLNSMLTPFFSMVGLVLLPYVSSRAGSVGGQVEVETRIGQLMRLYCAISLVMIGVVFMFGDYLLLVVFDTKYMIYTDLVKYMSLSILPNAIYLLLRNPLDAVSKRPFNTINLFIGFSAMVGILLWADDRVMFTAAFVIGYVLVGALSWMSWKYCLTQEMV